MKTHSAAVVSIHADRLAFDVKDILAALGSHLGDWVWCVRNLDWHGSEGAETICRAVDNAARGGVWATSPELHSLARGVYQTFDGEFWALPPTTDRATVTTQELILRAFPESQAELAIVAVEGGPF